MDKSESTSTITSKKMNQFSTFYVGENLYGLDVSTVQEVTKSLPMTKVPLASKFVCGLINLRGQIASAIGLRELFQLKLDDHPRESMNVVCKGNDLLLSLLVDQIGDVLEVSEDLFEPTPDTLSEEVSKFMLGVYKIEGNLLSILDISKIVEVLQKK